VLTKKIYHNPKRVSNCYILITISLACAWWFLDSNVIMCLSVVYFLILLFIILMQHQSRNNEKEFDLVKPEKLLIIAPHQDDCVLMAGGLALKNISIGGSVRIIYLSQNMDDEIAATRRKECIRVWGLAGLTKDCLEQKNLLPDLFEDPNTSKIEHARRYLQDYVDNYEPSMVVFPLFEGGHKQHDVTNYIASFLIKYPKRTLLYEAPIYSMYFSLLNTPHKIIKLIARFTSLNFLSYYPPVENIDNRKISVLHVSRNSIALKRKMLLEFSSQNGKSLSVNYGYEDRLVEWRPNKYRSQAFNYPKNLAFLIEIMYKKLSPSLANKIYPTDIVSHGCKKGITNLDYELGKNKVG